MWDRQDLRKSALFNANPIDFLGQWGLFAYVWCPPKHDRIHPVRCEYHWTMRQPQIHCDSCQLSSIPNGRAARYKARGLIPLMRKGKLSPPFTINCQAMPYAFPGNYASRTPDAASYRATNPAPLRTPDAVSYRAANLAPPRIPGTASYRAGDRGPLHPRAPFLVAPPSNESNHPPPFRRPSFSSITQPMLHSPSAHKSRAVSSTARAQHPSPSAAPAPFLPLPPRVGGSGMASSSGRHRVVSSGPSVRPSVPSTDLAPSFPPVIGHHNDTLFANSSQRARKKTLQHPTVHQRTLQQPSHHSVIQQHPMLKDFALIAAVTAARCDRNNNEFPWYLVWNIAIKDWMFSNSNTATVACNIAPQYVLSHQYNLEALSPGTAAKSKKTRVIPDFAQVLQHVTTSKNGTPILGRQKVILMVENKPKLSRQKIRGGVSPFPSIKKQISQQAAFAFVGDSSLHKIGMVVAFGDRWRYVEFARPRNTVLKAWTEAEDQMYGVTKTLLPEEVPEELRKLSVVKDYSFELLDHMGLSAQAFEIIAQRIKSRESEMWNL
ncbi:uncharacterized protein EDB91DRAFT_464219 [Suillus paluster]|uniref:uncharacterized protein n=1 Tax=Suillus paluster TaxID=48578 RepID=UPI001B8633DE|nr:uncharacterized protein EDB91DRAFT_464219 [Suillus paluster]KAG1719400.1 hypothetical protein EDB91DRAFT_464219 [Suillus paluster]